MSFRNILATIGALTLIVIFRTQLVQLLNMIATAGQSMP